MLEGRSEELAVLRARVAALSEGDPFATVLRGEAGAGKSAVLEAVADGASELRVLRLQGYEDEAEIPFAGLTELVTPLLPYAEQLPAVQQAALDSALARAAPQLHDRFTVPAALHGLLGLAAHERPVLVIADDVQWLDPASRDALVFVARRLAARSVGVLLAVREAAPDVDLAGIPVLPLGGLDAQSAEQLLAAHYPEVPRAVAERLINATAGNPLALLQLPRALTPEQRAGRAALEDPLQTTAAVQRAFSQRLGELPSETRAAMLIVAAAGRPTLDAVTAALELQGLTSSALGPAERAGLLTVAPGGELRFDHPLIRATTYRAATSSEQRAAHAALAQSTRDAPRRAWHLAAAATGRDESVALQLEAAAQDAKARGGHQEAARAFERAAELSDEPAHARRRALAAAQETAIGGTADAALALLDRASGDAAAPREEATIVARLRGHLLMRRGEPLLAREVLESAAAVAAEREGEAEMAATLYLESSISYTMAGDPAGMYAVLERAAQVAPPGGPSRLVADVMRAVADLITGATEAGRSQLDDLERRLYSASSVGLAEPAALLAQASLAIGELPRAARIVERVVAEHREASALGGLPFPLSVLAMIHHRQGLWGQALVEAQEAVEVAAACGQSLLHSFALGTLGAIEAGIGDGELALAHARAGLEVAEAAGATNHLPYHYVAIGRAEFVHGRLEQAAEAFDAAARARHELGWREPGVLLDAADHVEVLLRLGRVADADAAELALRGEAQQTGNPWAFAVLERSALLRAAPDAIDAHAAAALQWHEQDAMPFERARTLLAWGERLRRHRQRMRAREPLTQAHAVFTELGAAPWAERAWQELIAAGGAPAGTPPERTPQARTTLSAHELRIALMASYGMTNKEVGSALSLSPKTIERHLSSIYRQLGIRSRTELARVLAEQRD